jgi:hypothetical protein
VVRVAPVEVAEAAVLAERQESSVLRLADAVVFTIKRKLQNATDCDIFFGQIAKQLFVRAAAFGPFPADEHLDAQGWHQNGLTRFDTVFMLQTWGPR